MDDWRKMWQKIFGDTEAYLDFYQEVMYPKSVVCREVEQGELVSMLHMNPYPLQFPAGKGNGYYIVGVATKEEYRHQGRMAALLKEGAKKAREQKVPFLYLMPAKEAIYLPFGFRFVYTKRQVLWQGEGKEEADISLLPWNLAGEKERTEAVDYGIQRVKELAEVYPVPSVSYYERIQREMESAGGDLLLLTVQGKIQGHLSYMLEDGHGEITELLCPQESSEKILRAFAYSIQGKYQDILCLEGGSLPEKVTGTEKYIPRIMGRAVDPGAFVRLLSGKKELDFCVQMEDPLLEENNGLYQVHLGKVCSMERTKGKEGIPMNIGDFTKTCLENLGCRLYFNEIV